MIQTKEELFLAELGINTKEEIELAYGAKIKITDLLKKYETKQLLITYLTSLGYEVKDYGCYSEQSIDYPDYAHPVASHIESNPGSIGILLCGSGNGISMTANKHQAIRCALCWTPEIAELARLHNDANIISLPARFISIEEAKEEGLVEDLDDNVWKEKEEND